MLFYYKPVVFPQYTLSCDKLKFSFSFPDSASLEACLSALDSESNLNYYRSFKDCCFRNLFNFGVPGQSYAVGVDWNGFRQEDRLRGYLEFNPNKILGQLALSDGFLITNEEFAAQGSDAFAIRKQVISQFSLIWRILENYCEEIELKRWDVAVDVPYCRSEVMLIKDRRKYSQFYKSEEDFTEYLGCASNNGRVKVYNKQLEAGLDYALTRIEVTLDSLDYSKFLSSWPDIYVRHKIHLGNEKVMLQLLAKCDTNELGFYLKQLDFRTRKKYTDLLVDKPLEVEAAHFQHLVDMVSKDFLQFFYL